MLEGFIYLFTADDLHYKIGRSKDPEARLAQLDTGPLALRIIHRIATDDMAWLEGLLHHKYAHLHVRCEWFILALGVHGGVKGQRAAHLDSGEVKRRGRLDHQGPSQPLQQRPWHCRRKDHANGPGDERRIVGSHSRTGEHHIDIVLAP
jgi:hypothetical protein